MTSSPDFGRLAPRYDELRPADANWWELFALLVAEGDLRGRRVLDVGCGTGRLAAALAERGAARCGASTRRRRCWRSRAVACRQRRAEAGRAEELPFKDAWFERSVMQLVVHLVDRPTRVRRGSARRHGPRR